MEERLRSYELHITKVRDLEKKVKEYEELIDKLITDATPCFTSVMYKKFKCVDCGSKRLYAIKYKCTKCGSEGWWGYWPE